MSLEEGSMLKMNYTGRKKDDQTVFDTTLEEIAKQDGIYDENVIYKPCLVIIGKRWLPEGLEDQLIGLKPGDKKTIEIEAKKGFGLHDRSKIRLIQRREFQRLQIKPKVDMKVELGGQIGRILKVSSSRVKVDFNHDLAGHDLAYEVEIIKKITDIKEQLVALLERRLPGVDFSKTKIEVEGKKLVVTLPEHTKFMEFIQFTKNGVTRDIGEITSKYEEIVFIERFEVESS